MQTVQLIKRDDAKYCPFCMKFAVVELTPQQLVEQPDNTTHVCHPAIGGCNQGFGPTKKEGKDK